MSNDTYHMVVVLYYGRTVNDTNKRLKICYNVPIKTGTRPVKCDYKNPDSIRISDYTILYFKFIYFLKKGVPIRTHGFWGTMKGRKENRGKLTEDIAHVAL